MKTVLSDVVLQKIIALEGWLWENEVRALYDYASLALSRGKTDRVLVEIGSWKGKSTIAIGSACRVRKKGWVYAIDPYDLIGSARHPKERAALRMVEGAFRKHIADFGLHSYVRHLKMTSANAHIRYQSLRVCFVFIDGDHRYESVRFDADHWGKVLEHDGYMLLHDTLDHSGPHKVMRQLLFDPRYVYIGTIGNLSCFQKKRVLSVRNWIKKLYGYIAFWLFYKIYTPSVPS